MSLQHQDSSLEDTNVVKSLKNVASPISSRQYILYMGLCVCLWTLLRMPIANVFIDRISAYV